MVVSLRSSNAGYRPRTGRVRVQHSTFIFVITDMTLIGINGYIVGSLVPLPAWFPTLDVFADGVLSLPPCHPATLKCRVTHPGMNQFEVKVGGPIGRCRGDWGDGGFLNQPLNELDGRRCFPCDAVLLSSLYQVGIKSISKKTVLIRTIARAMMQTSYWEHSSITFIRRAGQNKMDEYLHGE